MPTSAAAAAAAACFWKACGYPPCASPWPSYLLGQPQAHKQRLRALLSNAAATALTTHKPGTYRAQARHLPRTSLARRASENHREKA